MFGIFPADSAGSAITGQENLAMIATIVTVLLGTFAFFISRRLILIVACSILFACPLVVIVYQAITVLNTDIRDAEHEQYGVKYHNRLIDLLQRIQEVRELTYAVRNGDASFAPELQSAKGKVRHTVAAIDDIDRAYGKMLATSQNWKAVKERISLLLETQNPQSPIEEFQQYSELVQSLCNFMDDVADNSNLSIDSQLDSDYLADAAVHVTPGIMETIGKMRGRITGLLASGKAPQQWTDKDILDLKTLYNELSFQDDDMENALERAQHANENSKRFIEYHDQTIEPVLGKLQKHFETMIFSRTNDFSAPETFALASTVIDLYDTLYDKTSDAFLDLLKRRQEEYTLKKNLVLYSSTAAFLGFIILFLFLYRTLAKTERAEQAAALANQTKTEFLANMSHELRTPLNSILGMNRLLLESRLTEDQQSLAETVFRSSANLLEIVNDILDISKIEAGEMKLENIGFNLQYVFHSVAHALEHIAREKRIPIIQHYEQATFPYVLGDPTRLGRVLTNLIGNAIKYTDQGHIDIRIFYKNLDQTHIEIQCEIIDTGIGIPLNKQKDIFEKFVQADTSTTRRYGGTGLGLAITKQLIELMGGTIGVRSIEGMGSTFWFKLPFEITDKLHEDKHIRRQKSLLGSIPLENARVLVAEDHPMNQVLIRKLLQKFGVSHIKIVDNGLDVLSAYKEGAWDIILMDCHMPEKNGYDTTKAIRDLEKTSGKHVPIIAMTANAMVGDKEKCLRYGMDEYVSKPINIEELKEILGQWIQFGNGGPPDQPSEAPLKDGPPIDLTELRTLTDGDLNTEKNLVGLFIGQSDENLRTLKKNCVPGECSAWVEAAHMFKGGALRAAVE